MKPLLDFNTVPCRLFVEGNSDAWVVLNLVKRHGANLPEAELKKPKAEMMFWHIAGTFNKDELSLFVKNAFDHYVRFGILTDADKDPIKKWEMIQNVFATLSCPLPLDKQDTMNTDAIFDLAKGKTQRVGIWLMPDNTSEGAIENFLLNLVPASGTDLSAYAATVTQEAKKECNAPYKEVDFKKAHIHTWLAWQKEPGISLSSAMNNGYFEHNNKLAQKFIDWFEKLFCEDIWNEKSV